MKKISKWVYLVCLLCFNLFVNAQSRPPLIPLPETVKWNGEMFDLKKCDAIVINSAALKKEGTILQQMLAGLGKRVKIAHSASFLKNSVILSLDSVKTERLPGEAYQLEVNKKTISLTANNVKGIFNGLQTLYQLIDKNKVEGCSITDYPAFSWRGYMVDVGRNFQSIALLKQQIDKMAMYKLNVFHFHLTEDIAWRLQIKQYPQLTEARYMERNKGEFYSIEQMKDLIQYCSDRYITLVPEIDIPGHSAAFKRAMGVDMQSPEGTQIIKNILAEICSTYNIPYLHIGADEVRITNKQFLPEVTRLIRDHKKKVIGWAPGGNYDQHTIRQLWKDEADKDVHNLATQYIDSKYLYISDFDPMNSVVTIFNRQLGGKLHGDSSLLGAEFCVWNDRKVTEQEDVVSKNPVYPDMLAFAERSWRGGGYPDVLFNIGPENSARAKEFEHFENRLLMHKERHFTQLPFNYVKQTHIKWNLYGPFNNGGDLNNTFWPEAKNTRIADSTAIIQATGGTVCLWPTHFPTVKGWLPDPKMNTTWYASSRFWSNTDTTLNFWIDFKDLSRSGADATPPKGEWDYMKSKLWLNNQIISPPNWAQAGRPAGRLEEPMVDENFYYRQPNQINVRRGWNTLLVKLPVGTFDPLLDWQVPPKLMFTIIPIHKGKGINWEADDRKFQFEK
jgi:hexosaminidase